jgi:hypothetical protein
MQQQSIPRGGRKTSCCISGAHTNDYRETLIICFKNMRKSGRLRITSQPLTYGLIQQPGVFPPMEGTG